MPGRIPDNCSAVSGMTVVETSSRIPGQARDDARSERHPGIRGSEYP
jgi:hypothetical protein